MTTRSFKASLSNGIYDTAGSADAKASAAAIDTTTVAANVATLVADGASPTQGHVNTLNTNWGTLLALINTAKSDAASGDCLLSYDEAVYDTNPKIWAMLRALAYRLGVPGIGV